MGFKKRSCGIIPPMKKIPETDRIIFEKGSWILHEVDVQRNDGKVGKKLYFERPNVVTIFPITEDGNLLCVKEYCSAVDRYEIFPPRGKVDLGETLEGAAQRELREEVGMRAHFLEKIITFSVFQKHITSETTAFLAKDLIPDPLPMDEGEELEVISIPLHEVDQWIGEGKITDARAIAGWLLIRDRVL